MATALKHLIAQNSNCNVSFKIIVRRTTPVPPSTTQFFEGKSDFISSLIISEYKSEIMNHCTASALGHAKYFQINIAKFHLEMATALKHLIAQNSNCNVSFKIIVRRTTPVPPSTTQFFEGKSDFISSLIISEYKSEIMNHCTASALGHAKLLFIYNVQNSNSSAMIGCLRTRVR